MGIVLADLCGISPYLYHVTYEDSLARIRRLRRLESADTLMTAGGQLDWLRRRRDSPLRFMVDEDKIELTDQIPINEKNIAFQSGWTLPDLIEALNRRVFFWRSHEAGLLRSNKGNSGKYGNDGRRLVFLRCDFSDAVTANAARGPELCRYNSGAARKNKGQPIPRGPNTFVRPEDADFPKGDVQEVVFREFVELPRTTECCSNCDTGPWHPLISPSHEE